MVEILSALAVGLLIPFCLWVSTTLVKILQEVSGAAEVRKNHIALLADHEARIRALEGFHQLEH